ncbi:CRISPR-associated endonuclease Cas1 [Candidatus Bathycorpusculum sp.]|uniref:CRISPR-associated endonuclease Cas1 n=1 Tax=Candidatus Bathycorpusculum sp. TaxID=2994959 RepID=UPI00282BDAA4|nr:CRISPR-associated endonuclease Cas1 [Candidatus Termitimicrobium sp.]MCL2431012.1 CRISPR-associated endonuclease Cas1 [Candidatus Termitimicrobium sp.]
MIIEISEHGSTLKRDHDCFIIQVSNEKTEIPAEKVDAIIVTANALVSTQAVALCLEKNIQLVLANWSGKPFGRFWVSTPGRVTEYRRKQYLHQNTPTAFKISKDIVTHKLRAQRKFLVDLKGNRKTPNETINNSINAINKSLKSLTDLEYVHSFKQTLLGIEGFAAAEYFSAVSSILPKKYAFKERSRQPAQDKFNAIINYIYGITYSSVEKIVILSGLDPNAGIYHADSYGKPTLVFDLIELFRAKVDRIVVKLFTKKQVKDSWFMSSDDAPLGVFLSKEGRKAVITAYMQDASDTVEKESWLYCRKIMAIFVKET